MSENRCQRCGHDAGLGSPQPSSCSHCDPVPCADCGGLDDRICSCWISLEGMPLADIKGLLALGDLSVSTPPAQADPS